MLQIISPRRRFSWAATTVMAAVALIAGCGDSEPLPPRAEQSVATAIPAREPAIRIVVLGDSLTAGLGLAEAESFPAIVESLLRDEGYDVKIVNAGVSGDTTAGGLSRIDWVLQKAAAILVVELGGNDALRGQPIKNTEQNLRGIIRRGRATGAKIILLGMDVPTNYGPDYASAFADLYPRLAEEEDAVLVPGFVRELGQDPTLLQPDGLHPTAEGQRRLAETLRPYLVKCLEAPISSSGQP